MKAATLRYIVVEGPIGVGKTTLAKHLADSFAGKVLLEGMDENPFLTRFYLDPKTYALSTQLFFLLQRSRQAQELSQNDMFAPVCVADFMVEKDRLFAMMTLNEDELRLYEQIYAHLTMDAPRPDLVIYLQAPVEVLMERIKKRGRSYEQGINEGYLSRLVELYMVFFHEYSAAPLLIVNTSELDFSGKNRDYNLLLEQVRKIRVGRHYFNPVPYQ
ncbi:MAG: deoxynucleoside kinase [Gammaproteobacteria bacterium]|nr:deoxynucleoside kinase [Gammaproteobacteria bacterium]